jgi:hypothetical protein
MRMRNGADADEDGGTKGRRSRKGGYGRKRSRIKGESRRGGAEGHMAVRMRIGAEAEDCG